MMDIECHNEDSGIIHFMPCCSYCSYCDRNIIETAAMVSHSSQCRDALKARDPDMFKRVEAWMVGNAKRPRHAKGES